MTTLIFESIWLAFISMLLFIQGGGYLLQLMDTYSCGWGVFVIGLSELYAILSLYG